MTGWLPEPAWVPLATQIQARGEKGVSFLPLVARQKKRAKHVVVLSGLFPDAGSIPAASTI